jgi:Ras-related protein Rab-1A
MDYDFLFKIILTGDSGTGKTAIFRRFIDDNYSENYVSTIGVDFKVKTFEIEEKITKLQIWDLAGSDRFRSVTGSYYKGSHGIIIVYDVSDRESFKHIEEWMEEIENKTDSEAVKIIVGNKIDNGDKKVISTEEGYEFAMKKGALFVECSAKNSINIDAIFSILISEIRKKAEIAKASGDLYTMKKSIVLHETYDIGVSKDNCCTIV